MCNNETMKQYRSVLRKISQRVIVSQINYLPQPLASQIIVPSDLVYFSMFCFFSSEFPVDV